jgi:hypothetical protein
MFLTRGTIYYVIKMSYDLCVLRIPKIYKKNQQDSMTIEGDKMTMLMQTKSLFGKLVFVFVSKNCFKKKN